MEQIISNIRQVRFMFTVLFIFSLMYKAVVRSEVIPSEIIRGIVFSLSVVGFISAIIIFFIYELKRKYQPNRNESIEGADRPYLEIENIVDACWPKCLPTEIPGFNFIAIVALIIFFIAGRALTLKDTAEVIIFNASLFFLALAILYYADKKEAEELRGS